MKALVNKDKIIALAEAKKNYLKRQRRQARHIVWKACRTKTTGMLWWKKTRLRREDEAIEYYQWHTFGFEHFEVNEHSRQKRWLPRMSPQKYYQPAIERCERYIALAEDVSSINCVLVTHEELAWLKSRYNNGLQESN